MSEGRACARCGLVRPAASFQLTGGGYRHTVCSSCVAGAQRVAALARTRPHLRELAPEASAVLLAWETGRRALTRALRSAGVRIVWRGFDPVVTFVANPLLAKPAVHSHRERARQGPQGLPPATF